MSLGFKRSRSTTERDGRSRRDGQTETESLFEKEWDELVIRFDNESRQYRVGTTSEPPEQTKELYTAKLTP